MGVGGRTNYAPAKLPAVALDYGLSRPLEKFRYLHHQVYLGLWHRQENRTPTGIIVVPAAGPLPYYTTAYASYGIGLRSAGRLYIYVDHGIGIISETTQYLGTHGQFMTSLGIGYRDGKRSFECGVRHLSNGSRYFGTPGINSGEDLFLCSVSIAR